MNLRKPDFDDELGQSIRQALKRQTDDATPSKAIWPHIRSELEMNRPAGAVRGKWYLSPPALQALGILLMLIVGSLALRPPASPEQEMPILIAQASPSGSQFNAETYVDEYSIRRQSRGIQSEFERHQLQDYAAVTAQDLSAFNTPVVVVPLNKVPNPRSLESWLTNSDISEGASDPIVWQINQAGYLVRSGLIQ